MQLIDRSKTPKEAAATIIRLARYQASQHRDMAAQFGHAKVHHTTKAEALEEFAELIETIKFEG